MGDEKRHFFLGARNLLLGGKILQKDKVGHTLKFYLALSPKEFIPLMYRTERRLSNRHYFNFARIICTDQYGGFNSVRGVTLLGVIECGTIPEDLEVYSEHRSACSLRQ